MRAAGLSLFITGSEFSMSALMFGTIRPLKKQHSIVNAMVIPTLADSDILPKQPTQKPKDTPNSAEIIPDT